VGKLNALIFEASNHTKNKIMATYISFIGFLETPTESDLLTLSRIYPPNISEVLQGYDSHDEPVYRDYNEGFRTGLEYKEIGGKDSLTIYLAVVPGYNHIGHLVADCTPGGWVSDTFVMLDENSQPIKAAENFNPNPVEQLL
jgi:hypothetical protein